MFQIMKINKKTREVSFVEVSSYNRLELEIANIKTNDLKYNDYFIKYSVSIKFFLEKKYNKNFFSYNEEMNCYQLHILKNGVRRARTFSRKIDSNETLHRALAKIKKDLLEDLDAIKMTCEINEGDYEKGQYQLIHIKLIDKTKISQRPNSCVIKFDKNKWEFEILSINTINLKEVYNIIQKIFERRTASTRNYRKKSNANNS